MEIPRVREVSKAHFFNVRTCMILKWNFQRGGGGGGGGEFNLKKPSMGGV